MAQGSWHSSAVQPLEHFCLLLQLSVEFNRPSPPVDDWELEPSEIAFQEKIASGAFGDLYKGAYCGQDVAIKIVRNVQDNTQQFQEFLQVMFCPHDRMSICLAMQWSSYGLCGEASACCMAASNFVTTVDLRNACMHEH